MESAGLSPFEGHDCCGGHRGVFTGDFEGMDMGCSSQDDIASRSASMSTIEGRMFANSVGCADMLV